MFFLGSITREKEASSGVFYCPDCRDDCSYKRIQTMQHFILFIVPLPGQMVNDRVECASCGGRHDPDILAWNRDDLAAFMSHWQCKKCNGTNKPRAEFCAHCRAEFPFGQWAKATESRVNEPGLVATASEARRYLLENHPPEIPDELIAAALPKEYGPVESQKAGQRCFVFFCPADFCGVHTGTILACVMVPCSPDRQFQVAWNYDYAEDQ